MYLQSSRSKQFYLVGKIIYVYLIKLYTATLINSKLYHRIGKPHVKEINTFFVFPKVIILGYFGKAIENYFCLLFPGVLKFTAILAAHYLKNAMVFVVV